MISDASTGITFSFPPLGIFPLLALCSPPSCQRRSGEAVGTAFLVDSSADAIEAGRLQDTVCHSNTSTSRLCKT
ncbi:hypothetical protein LZ31DRAFT_366188 [Colletotrichum somersetense]|nr:hypothetical protein LZ31DRAFT_366188 [Colletotrichum somersetense]